MRVEPEHGAFSASQARSCEAVGGDWLEGRGPRLTALGAQDDATGKILAAQFFPLLILERLFFAAGEKPSYQ
jgi:hypothetical protein